MNAIEQTDFMSQLREANPQLGHLSSLQLLDQAAEDTEEIGSLADALRIENPEHAHLSSGKLIGLAIKHNPDAFMGAPAEPEWKAFPPESGSLNVPRSSMPQIRSEHRGAMVQSAVEVAQSTGDSETAGMSALTILEELSEHLAADDLSITYQRAAELLTSSRDPESLLRLNLCACRVLFLIGASPTPATWDGFSLKEAVRRYEKRIIERALRDVGGLVTRAARLLGYGNHNTLIKKLREQYPELLCERKPAKSRRRSIILFNDGEKETGTVIILHVEDNKLVAGAAKDTLAREGWSVETCNEGTVALQILSNEAHYDVLIFDNELPDMSGLELIREARQLPHRQHTPIIMFSASNVEREARQAGANAFLRKPEDVTALAETVARVLAQQSKSSTGK